MLKLEIATPMQSIHQVGGTEEDHRDVPLGFMPRETHVATGPARMAEEYRGRGQRHVVLPSPGVIDAEIVAGHGPPRPVCVPLSELALEQVPDVFIQETV